MSSVLLVEDDARVRETLRLCLEHLGYDVREAGNGAEALALAERHQPDLILLDLGLPDADGLGVAQELRRRPTTTHLPLAILTGQWLTGRRVHILTSICAGIIPKPVTLARFGRDIRILLMRPRGGIRRFPRYPAEASVGWRLHGGSVPSEPDYAPGVARTISEGGLELELPMPLAVGSLLTLRLPRAAAEVKAPGRVIWSRFHRAAESGSDAYRHGVQFVDLDRQSLEALQGLVEEAGAGSPWGPQYSS